MTLTTHTSSGRGNHR